MKLHRFYIQLPLGEKEVIIRKEKENKKERIDLIHQWKTVLKLSIGEEIVLFNGETSQEYMYAIEKLDKDECVLSLRSATEIEKRVTKNITLCMGIIKSEFDTVVRQATELGVSAIIPLIAKRSEKKDVNVDRLQAIAVEASEQCGRVDIPTIHAPQTTEEIFKGFTEANQMHIVLDMHGEPLAKVERNENKNLYAWVGPEGGWTMDEMDYFKQKGVSFVSLPTYTLKANTAGPVAVFSLL